ncbi:hypothetical protein CONLIGDRAFT_639910 [Coniochaeta ligniaria NRRL 30616]|uniref:HCNGP-domain-containing protein n=1 Tax=Coniochaeta ligniaria NRRL 30616 TaxID=1408157 RepID=A0A1J7K1Q5_9PEZI|nr:hypothetical protein CONLIGDRAFT_639910 [Coniochaeta ligniaria NRRL 30616]
MAGLVGYDSSDDDEEVQEPTQVQTTATTDKQQENGSSSPSQAALSAPPQPANQAPSSASTPPAQLGPLQGPALGPSLGPALGPSLPSTLSISPAPSPSAQQDQPDPPRSPYSSTRALIHDLTLPSVPNTAIPPSPPGSPPRALTAKFDTFLSLKATKAMHFNARLAESKAVRNPALMDKLLGFVGVETSFDNSDQKAEPGQGPEQQYATTLPTEIWDPAAMPAWAYKTPLRRAQERAAKERERRVGEPVEFVSASGGGSRSGTPGTVAPVTGKRKTRFDQ